MSATTVDVLVALARELHAAGVPAHRLEAAVVRTARALGACAQVMSLPTGMMLSVGGVGAEPAVRVLRVRPAAVNLERLAELEAVADALAAGSLDAAAALDRLRAVKAAKPRWGRAAVAASYPASAAAFAVFFGGGGREVLTAALAGLVVGVLTVARPPRPGAAGRVYELTAAAAATFVIGVADLALGGYSDIIAVAASLVVLLPGINLVVAVEELSHGHLTSGAGRLAGAGVVFLALTFGAVSGWAAAACFEASDAEPTPAPLPASWAVPASLGLVALGSLVRFRANPRDFAVILAASVLAYGASRLGRSAFGPLAGPFAGALALGLASQLYQRRFARPAEVFAIPGLALLVPGSMGLHGLTDLADKNAAHGVQTMFEMLMVAIALVSGLLFGTALGGRPLDDDGAG